MEQGAQRKLTLLSAPAGFGKTTLVSEWLAARGRRAAWLSLDADDRDPPRFLAHLVAALQTVAPDVGQGVAQALGAPQVPPVPWLLAELLNDLAAAPDDVLAVLDDLHAVEGVAIPEALGYLLDHLPPHVHLVLTTREDPPLRLGMLRARDQLIEIRAADLRFRHEEAAAFLEGGVGAPLSAEAVATLEARTEGWIAGLQLAALSLRGRDDVSDFLRSFAGDHRYVVDYLVEEVLDRQPADVRRFLLETAILDRLTGGLCDALTGRHDSAALLDALERANLFLVPLDDTRRWYRYHQLFADVLRAHLAQEGEDVAALHARASTWFETQGELEDAVRHALEAEDPERAARLVEVAWRAMDSTFRSSAWRAWAEALPETVVHARPALSAGLAWAHLNAGELDAADRRLESIEAWLEETGGAADTAAREASAGRAAASSDAGAMSQLAGTVASARAFHALATRAAAAAVEHGRRALRLLAADDPARGVPLGILSLAHWANGELDEAYRILDDAMQGFRASGNAIAAASGTFGAGRHPRYPGAAS